MKYHMLFLRIMYILCFNFDTNLTEELSMNKAKKFCNSYNNSCSKKTRAHIFSKYYFHNHWNILYENILQKNSPEKIMNFS